MERILSYDLAVRQLPPASAARPVAGLVEYLNGGPDHIVCSYDPKSSSFFLWSDGKVSLRLSSHSGSGNCILGYLPFRSLNLDIATPFDLANLHGLPIESLDVHKCAAVGLRKPVSLPLLREIRVRPGQFKKGALRRWIRSGKRFEILEASEDS